MNEAETKRKKGYAFLLSFFRLMMVVFFAYQILGDFWNDSIDSVLVTKISILSLYVFGMLLLPVSRIALYVETIVIIGLIVFFDQSHLISLFVFPLAISMVGEVKKWDMVAVPSILFVAIFYAFGWNPITIAFSIGLFVFFFIKERESFVKFEELKGLRISLGQKEKSIQELELENMSKDKENEIVTEMFVKIKNLNEKIDIDELIDDLVASPKSFFNAEYVAAYIFNEGRYRLFKEAGKNRRFNVSEELDASEAEKEEYTDESLSVSLELEGNPWGLIKVFGKKEYIYAHGQKVSSRFNEDDFEILALYSEQVMYSIRHAKALMRMEELANNDFLTKIPNRRYFMDKFNYLINRAKRGEQLAVLILDVDFFKKFNDTYGHDKGDEVLKVVAEALSDYVREMDFVGRLGGEEFGVLIPNADRETLIIAERLRKTISLIPFIEPITVSIGVSYYGKDGTTIDELYNNADRALYDAKESGRNRVCEYKGQ